MPTAAGCLARRQRLLASGDWPSPLVLRDPLNLCYFANFYADPFSLGADYGGLLVIRADGHATLYHDSRVSATVQFAHVDEVVKTKWYDGQTPGKGTRRMILRESLVKVSRDRRIHDSLGDETAPELWDAITAMRRVKDADEIEQLKACMTASEAGHAWARANVKPGMTELEVYTGVTQACVLSAGHAVVTYGDFTVATGDKRGGPPTLHKLEAGETLILDYSVVIQGYRSDFTNTLVVGGSPTAGQAELFTLCVQAMAAGEEKLKAGTPCQAVYDAVMAVFKSAGRGDEFPHHAGHGLGLSHPEAPFFVKHSAETLQAGDVVTLEPGLYAEGTGGVRIEHNYLVTDKGYERLSHHTIALS